MKKNRLGSCIWTAVALVSVLCLGSCSKDDRTESQKAQLEDVLAGIRSDFRTTPGLAFLSVDNISCTGGGYDATFGLFKGQKNFASLHLEGDFIHSADGIIYGVSANLIRIDIDGKLILEGSNQNLVEYVETLASLCAIKDATKLEYAIAFANSMGEMTVYYPGKTAPAGMLEIVSVPQKEHLAPAFAIRLAGSRTYVELNTPLDRIFRLSSDIVNLLP